MPDLPPPRRFAALLIGVVVTLVALVVSGCGGGTPKIAVTDAFVPVPATADSAAAYLTITNDGDADDVLQRVTTPIASSTHLHETSIDSQGRAKMAGVGTLTIPAGSTVRLAPGGLHLMMMQPKVPAAGETVELTLTFEHAGTKKVTAKVVDDISEVLDR